MAFRFIIARVISARLVTTTHDVGQYLEFGIAIYQVLSNHFQVLTTDCHAGNNRNRLNVLCCVRMKLLNHTKGEETVCRVSPLSRTGIHQGLLSFDLKSLAATKKSITDSRGKQMD